MDGNIKNSYATGDVTGNYQVGGLVGTVTGSITNSYATGSVAGDGNLGGLVGAVFGGDITNSYATGSVTSTGGDAGGLVGALYQGSITNSYATGSVTGSEPAVGGLVGTAHGDITNSYATGSVIGRRCVGGLAGYAMGNITNSYATGNVTGNVTGNGDTVGGLAGEAYSNITSSYATGSVTGSEKVGGLAGLAGGSIANSYATGSVTGSGDSVGGLAGEVDGNGTVRNSAALNPSVTGGSDVGRVAGSKAVTGNLDSNYAFAGMAVTVGSSAKTPLVEGGDKLDGADIKIPDVTNAKFWNDMGFDAEVWKIADRTMPTLNGVKGQTTAIPLHLIGYAKNKMTINLANGNPVYEMDIPFEETIVELTVKGIENWTDNLIVWSKDGKGTLSTTEGKTTLTIPARQSAEIVITAENKNAGKKAICTIQFKMPKPTITGISITPSAAVTVDSSATMTVTASELLDDATREYKWYKNVTDSNENGTLLEVVKTASWTPPVDTVGRFYYYCIITDTIVDAGEPKSSISDPSAVAELTVMNHTSRGSSSSKVSEYTVTLQFKNEDGKTIDTQKIKMKKNTVLTEKNLKLPKGFELEDEDWSHKVVKAETINVEVKEIDPPFVVIMTIGSTIMTVNETEVGMDVAPYIDSVTDRTMIPLRFAAAAFGLADGDVEWIAETKQVIVTDEESGKQITLTIGSNVVSVIDEDGNLELITIDQWAVIKDDRTFVPFRAVAEILGCEVAWDGETKTVEMTKK